MIHPSITNEVCNRALCAGIALASAMRSLIALIVMGAAMWAVNAAPQKRAAHKDKVNG